MKPNSIAIALTLIVGPVAGWAEFRTGLEAGAAFQSRNDVRIPGDTGTTFSLKDVQGSGPVPAIRAWVEWIAREKHGVRLTAAPLRVEGTGTLDQDVFFVDKTFSQNAPVDASFKFDTYRATYRYRFFNTEAWTWKVGGTLLLRDAKIELIQGSQQASKSNVGAVPLLNFAGEWRPAPKWQALFEFDGLAGGPGRAFDVTLQTYYDISERWQLGGGYRTIEGGSDTDEVYSFAWFHIFTLSLNYRFQ
jgi:hypothetical protein